MRRLPRFLAPVLLLSIGAALFAGPGDVAVAGRRPEMPPFDRFSAMPTQITRWQPPEWWQVRIERHVLVRITPGVVAMPPAMVEQLEEMQRPERRFNKCLVTAAIGWVQPGDGDELLLVMRDQRLVSVQLEKHCSARDFYQGFYVASNADGAICPGRDILQSRSGANCKVKRLGELAPAGTRRIP